MKTKHKTIIGLVAMAMSVTSALACFVTIYPVCVPAGTVIEHTPVWCNVGSSKAYLANQTYTTANAITANAIDVNYVWGRNLDVAVHVINTVGIGTRTVDPHSCDITINPNAGTIVIVCPGRMADTVNGMECIGVD